MVITRVKIQCLKHAIFPELNSCTIYWKAYIVYTSHPVSTFELIEIFISSPKIYRYASEDITPRRRKMAMK